MVAKDSHITLEFILSNKELVWNTLESQEFNNTFKQRLERWMISNTIHFNFDKYNTHRVPILSVNNCKKYYKKSKYNIQNQIVANILFYYIEIKRLRPLSAFSRVRDSYRLIKQSEYLTKHFTNPTKVAELVT